MIEIDAAITLVREAAHPLPPHRVPLAHSVGRVLAEPIASDLDSPPYDKALMDGFALRSTDVQGDETRLRLVEVVTAGNLPQRTVEPGQCIQIMTGTPLPSGADAVVMIERTDRRESLPGNSEVLIWDASLRPETNVLRRGASMQAGTRLLPPGHRVRAADIGLMAEVGCAEVTVIGTPTLAILSTGDELVPHAERPPAGKIRNSNGPMLAALGTASGADTVELGIIPDTREALAKAIEQGLEHDVMLLSGGVSAGMLDLVPQALAAAGVEQIFHKVNLKPGKPIWFGKRSDGRPCLVFGLPGNPVSALVCFRLFVMTALRVLEGNPQAAESTQTARLAEPFAQRADRPTYWPAVLEVEANRQTVRPLPWQGSADQRTIAAANALMFVPGGPRELAAGESVDVLELVARD